jgi:hypothetical protein
MLVRKSQEKIYFEDLGVRGKIESLLKLVSENQGVKIRNRINWQRMGSVNVKRYV